MQFLSGCNSRQITLVGLALLIQAFLIYVIMYMNVTWSRDTSCIDVFQRPHEQHRIKVRPLKHIIPFNELEANDTLNLVDLRNFTYINRNEVTCANSDIFLLVIIPSAPKNTKKREAIRKTWGSKDPDVKIFFMLGMGDDEETEQAIEEESKQNGDIVQGNFVDSYKNMTYKAVMSLKYVIYYCSQAIYILKVDDDSFVNMPFLKIFLKHDLSPYGAENLFLCNDMTGSPAIREPDSKWYVPKEDFPDAFYPSYCSGWYAIFSMDVCFTLYKESQKLKYLFIDDAFVYGIAARNGGLTHIDFSDYTLAYRKFDLLLNGTYDKIPILFGSPNMSPQSIEKFYEYFKNKPVPQSINKKLG